MPRTQSQVPFASKISNFIYKNRYLIFLLLMGLTLIGLGVLMAKTGGFSSDKVEILEEGSQNEGTENKEETVVEIAGAVINPGVYKLENNARVEDLLIAAKGLSENADRDWVAKNINRAAKLTDGQKIYIPTTSQTKEITNYQSNVLSANNSGGYQNVSADFSSQGSGLTNINSASQNQLESLVGIGPVYAQKIIEQRPYSTTSELVSKGVIGQTLYEKIKNDISVY